MTRFFNQKEEVLQIELTPYGKHKLSNGEMRPEYYAFYDDSILYDGKLGGIVENQNAIVERIENTPQLTPQGCFKSNESQEIRTVGLNISDYDTLTEANSKFFKVIGDSSPGSAKKPAIVSAPSFIIRFSKFLAILLEKFSSVSFSKPNFQKWGQSV